MSIKKAKAVAPTTAPNTELPNSSYNHTHLMSRQLKTEIGEMLLCLKFLQEPALQYIGLELFEEMLRQYVDKQILGEVQ